MPLHHVEKRHRCDAQHEMKMRLLLSS